MSHQRKLGGHPLNTGGFLSTSLLADLAVLLILTYFAIHTAGRSGELLAADSASVAAWAPVVLASVMLLVLIPFVAGRLWSQLSTRYTSEGVSQWRFLSYRVLQWPEIRRVYYDERGLILEGQISVIRVITGFYRRPEQVLGVVHAHVSGTPEQAARERASVTELRRGGARASSA